MDFDLSEWLNLIGRWVHVFAGILWIGQTYFFTWLDHNLHAGEGDSVWMVHSGGFYAVGKRTTLGVSPASVRWFRWEAAITWLSGMFLLVLVYYFGGLLLEADSKLSLGTAIAIGVAVLVVGWLLYDFIWLSPLARPEGAAVALCFVLMAGAVYGLTHVFSGRAAYMHVGAARHGDGGQCLDAHPAGPAPDDCRGGGRENARPTLSARAKLRPSTTPSW
jgi:uncharacterized membrane protein